MVSGAVSVDFDWVIVYKIQKLCHRRLKLKVIDVIISVTCNPQRSRLSL